jgi:hypothetical protein
LNSLPTVGLLAVRTGMLPVWLGWVTVVLGIVCLTPVGFVALLLGWSGS